MGMSTHVVGIVPADEEYTNKMKAFNACQEAGIHPPDELWDFFGGERPEPEGIIEYIDDEDFVSEWQDDMREGYEIDVTKLPKKYKLIRVYNSW